MHENDREALAAAEESLRTQIEETKKSVTDKGSLAAAQEMLSLLDKPRLAIASSEELCGSWRVRSLQTGQFGAYAYPFFKCRISAEGKTLVFHKATGSQRRQGTLARAGEKQYLFTGGSYYEGDPIGNYLGSKDHPTGEQMNRNSVGYLYKLGKGHYLMIFAPQLPNGEVYEIKK